MGWFADFLSNLGFEVTKPGSKLLYGRLPHVAGWEHDPEPVRPGTRYMRWWVQEMWLRDARVLFDEYTPVVYSTVKLTFGDQEVEIPAVAGDFQISGLTDLKGMQDVLKLNYPLTSFLPYNGGSVSLAAALVGLRTKQGLSEVIDAISELSSKLAVPQLSAVTSVAAPVLKVLDSVLSQGEKRLALGVHQSFAHGGQEELRSGYFLSARVEQGPGILKELIVQDGNLCWRDGLAQVKEFDYMLFRLEMTEERSDLESLTEIFDLVDKAEELAQGGSDEDVDRARKYLQQAKLAAWQSEDLTRADRTRVPQAIDEKFAEYLRIMGIVGGGAGFDPDAAETVPLSELVTSISPADALKVQESSVLDLVFDA